MSPRDWCPCKNRATWRGTTPTGRRALNPNAGFGRGTPRCPQSPRSWDRRDTESPSRPRKDQPCRHLDLIPQRGEGAACRRDFVSGVLEDECVLHGRAAVPASSGRWADWPLCLSTVLSPLPFTASVHPAICHLSVQHPAGAPHALTPPLATSGSRLSPALPCLPVRRKGQVWAFAQSPPQHLASSGAACSGGWRGGPWGPGSSVCWGQGLRSSDGAVGSAQRGSHGWVGAGSGPAQSRVDAAGRAGCSKGH